VKAYAEEATLVWPVPYKQLKQLAYGV